MGLRKVVGIATSTTDADSMKMIVPEDLIMTIGVVEEAGVAGGNGRIGVVEEAWVEVGSNGHKIGSLRGATLIRGMETLGLTEIIRGIKDEIITIVKR